MEWGWIIIMALAILGAGSIAGGVVAYRGSARVEVRAFGAAAVAVGVVMWAMLLVVTPAYQTSEEPTAPTVELGKLAD